MNKVEKRELANLDVMARMISTISDNGMREISVGYLARSYSALARASLRSKNQIITALFILILVLIVRPQGIFGRSQRVG